MSLIESLIRRERTGVDDGAGELYEVMTLRDTKETPKARKLRVKELLATWHRQYAEYGSSADAPTFSLEVHALRESPDDRPVPDSPYDDPISNPMDGIGTYAFIPEATRRATSVVIGNVFASPVDVPDDFDVLKVLARTYAGERDMGLPPVATRELSLAEPGYLPLAAWDDGSPVDPMGELYALLETLRPGEFAGVCLACRMAPPSWADEGNMRIREIEDPNYIAHPTMFQRVSALLRDDPEGKVQMGGRVDRLAGYDTQSIDAAERAEIAAISAKRDEGVFVCTLRVYASSDAMADEICGLIKQRTGGRWNRLVVSSDRCRMEDLAKRRIGRSSFMLCPEEIASIWHVPDEGNASPRLHKAPPQISTPPESVVIVPKGADGDIKSLLIDYIETQRSGRAGRRGVGDSGPGAAR